VGLGGATLAQLSTTHPNMQLVCAGGITATFLLIASAASAFAAAPTDCWLGGGSPDLLRVWLWDQGKWRDEATMLEATACRHAEAIRKNDIILRKRGRRALGALLIAVVAPILGVASILCDRVDGPRLILRASFERHVLLRRGRTGRCSRFFVRHRLVYPWLLSGI
jgi:hypothetical protein